MKNTVLVIAYYFPPMGLSGVQRTLKFVKYLPEFGWKPIVLTTTENTPYYAFDQTLMDEIAPLIAEGKIEIHRTDEDPSIGKAVKKDGKLMKLPRQGWQRTRSKIIQMFRQPDSRIKWKEFAVNKAAEILESHHIDAIFTTAPPFTDFLIAKELKEKYQIPYLMDYRDAWVENPIMNFYITPFHKRKAQEMEYASLRASNAITTANRKMKEVLLQSYEFLDWNDVHLLSHGYDPEDFARAETHVEKYRSTESFRLTYSGAFQSGRSPKVFFQAVVAAIKAKPELASNLELSFVGILQKEYKKLAKKMGIGHLITEVGYLPHIEAVAYLLASDVLWMTVHEPYSAPGKLYEYFGTRKPIIGLAPEDSHTAKHLQEYGNAVAIAPDDVEKTTQTILAYYRQWKEWTLPNTVNEEFVARLDRRLITKELARHLTFISGSLEGEIKRLRMKTA